MVWLPETGLVFRFSAGMGLNLDGSSNLGVRAIPDFPIEAKNSEERLEKLLVFFTVKPFLRLSIFDIVFDLTYRRRLVKNVRVSSFMKA